MNKKGDFTIKLLLFLILITLISLVSVISYFVYFAVNHQSIKDIPVPPIYKNITNSTCFETSNNNILCPKIVNVTKIIIINESTISYLLYIIGANKLHNPPFSSDTPKINIFIENDRFNSEVNSGEIITLKGQIENEDIQLVSNYETIIKILSSKNPKYEIKLAVQDGNFEIKALKENIVLASKGYLSLYQEFSGRVEGSSALDYTAEESRVSENKSMMYYIIAGLIVLLTILIIVLIILKKGQKNTPTNSS